VLNVFLSKYYFYYQFGVVDLISWCSTKLCQFWGKVTWGRNLLN
jgi:hypothetical protein